VKGNDDTKQLKGERRNKNEVVSKYPKQTLVAITSIIRKQQQQQKK
jgi:hypothetical protein